MGINSHTHNKNAIGYKWIFKLKYLANGTIERYKAHTIVKGFTRNEGLDYQQAFSPIIKMTNIRLLLPNATYQGLYLHQLDINISFLHGTWMRRFTLKVPLISILLPRT